MPVPVSRVTNLSRMTRKTTFSNPLASAAKRSNGGLYRLPSRDAAGTETSVRFVFVLAANASASLSATSKYRLPASMIRNVTWSSLGTAAYIFDGKVHGVVVQTASAISLSSSCAFARSEGHQGGSTRGNPTYTLGSSTVLYPWPPSPELSAVPPCSHHQTTLCPWSIGR